jgi:hypothetical protein
MPVIRAFFSYSLLLEKFVKFAFNKGSDFSQTLAGCGLKPENNNRLGIGRTDQPPAVIEDDPDAIHVNQVVTIFREIASYRVHHIEFLFVRAIDPDFRG